LIFLSRAHVDSHHCFRVANREFNAKDRASLLDFQCRGDFGIGSHCVQLVLRLNQRNILFAFQQRKDRLDLQVVGDDFLADLQRKVSHIEGERNTISQPHATNSHDALAPSHRDADAHNVEVHNRAQLARENAEEFLRRGA